MRFCSKCGDFHADRLLAFCPADGTPLADVDPGSNTWSEGVRAIEQKRNEQRTHQRRLKWRRVISRAMLMATMVVTVAAVSRSISVTVVKPKGELCIATFNDLNGNGIQDTGELIVADFRFQVSGEAAPATTLTTGPNVGCESFPVGTYTVVEQPQGGWTATTLTTQTVAITAGQSANVLFGSKPDRPRNTGKLCITTFDDKNGNGKQDAGEAVLSGFVFEVSGTDPGSTFKKDLEGGACSEVPVGRYTVVETPKPGWITPPPQTVIVTAGQTLNVLFGSRQQTGKLCVSAFDDKNGNGKQDTGEAVLSGFVFEVSGTDPGSTFKKDLESGFCSGLPVGTYTVVEIPKPGWNPATKAPQKVTLTANPTVNLFFGNRAINDSVCSDADKRRELENIMSQHRKIWTTTITGGRAVPTEKDGKNVPAARDNVKFETTFNGCSHAFVTVTYTPQVPGAAPVPKVEKYECLKTGNDWKCR